MTAVSLLFSKYRCIRIQGYPGTPCFNERTMCTHARTRVPVHVDSVCTQYSVHTTVRLELTAFLRIVFTLTDGVDEPSVVVRGVHRSSVRRISPLQRLDVLGSLPNERSDPPRHYGCSWVPAAGPAGAAVATGSLSHFLWDAAAGVSRALN